MAKKPKTYGPYECVAPSRRHIGGFSSLWMTKDHLLLADCNGYTESYGRFYFRDLQAFMVEDTSRRLVISISLGLAALFFSGISVLNEAHFGFYLAWLLLFGVPLIVNLVRGPGCALYLVTKVQAIRVKAVSRRARAEAVIARLQPLVEAAQADLLPPPPQAEPAPSAFASEERFQSPQQPATPAGESSMS